MKPGPDLPPSNAARTAPGAVAGRSPIDGNGLFAARAFEADESIVAYTGAVLPNGRSCADDRYLLEIDAETWIDGGRSESPARFVNHGCEPNCELILEDGVVWLKSARAIDAGEELLVDYGYRPREAIGRRCRCGSPRCCGYVVGRPWRAELFRLLAHLRRTRSAGGPGSVSRWGDD